MPVSVTIKVYHCVNGDGLFDRQIGFRTHSVHQCKFDRDYDGDGSVNGPLQQEVNKKHSREKVLVKKQPFEQ